MSDRCEGEDKCKKVGIFPTELFNFSWPVWSGELQYEKDLENIFVFCQTFVVPHLTDQLRL